MAAKFNIDKLDLRIIQQLMHDASISYAEMGKKLFVSAGTVHVRIKKLQEAGVPNLWIPKHLQRVQTIPVLASGKLDLKRCQDCAAMNRCALTD